MSRESIEKDNTRYQTAIGRGVREAVLENFRLGLPVPVWRDASVIWVPAADFLKAHPAEPLTSLEDELRSLPEDKLFLAAAYIRQLRES